MESGKTSYNRPSPKCGVPHFGRVGRDVVRKEHMKALTIRFYFRRTRPWVEWHVSANPYPLRRKPRRGKGPNPDAGSLLFAEVITQPKGEQNEAQD